LISAAAPPQTPLGELTVLPKPASWIQGVLLPWEGKRETKKREGEERKKGKARREGKGGRRGRSKWDISPPPSWLKRRSATVKGLPTLMTLNDLEI